MKFTYNLLIREFRIWTHQVTARREENPIFCVKAYTYIFCMIKYRANVYALTHVVSNNNFQIWRPQCLGLILVIYLMRETLKFLCGPIKRGQEAWSWQCLLHVTLPHTIFGYLFLPTRDIDMLALGPQYKITNSSSNHDLCQHTFMIYVSIYIYVQLRICTLCIGIITKSICIVPKY